MSAASRARADFLHQTSLRLPTVNRAMALYAALLAGFWGGHKFLMGARREGWLYLVLSWTGLTVFAALADFVVLCRQPVVGRGFLRRRLVARHPADRDTVEARTCRVLALSGATFVVLAALVALVPWAR